MEEEKKELANQVRQKLNELNNLIVQCNDLGLDIQINGINRSTNMKYSKLECEISEKVIY